jgi:hypothetical protein
MIRAPHGGAAAAEGSPHGQSDLIRKCSCGGTGRECYINLQEPWDVAFTEYRPNGKTEERLKYRRRLFIVRARDKRLRESVRTFSSGKVCKRVRFLRDNKGPFCYHPFPVGIRGPCCCHPFPVGTGRPRTKSLAPAPQQAGDVETTRGHVQPGRGPLGVRGSGRLWAFGESLTCALGGVFWYRLVAESTTHLDGTSGAGFKGARSAVRDMETKGGTNLARARSHFDTKFQFAAPKAPRFRDIVRRLVEATRSALRIAVRTRALADEELSAVFGRVMVRLNNVPVACTMRIQGGTLDICKFERLCDLGESLFVLLTFGTPVFRLAPPPPPRIKPEPGTIHVKGEISAVKREGFGRKCVSAQLREFFTREPESEPKRTKVTPPVRRTRLGSSREAVTNTPTARPSLSRSTSTSATSTSTSPCRTRAIAGAVHLSVVVGDASWSSSSSSSGSPQGLFYSALYVLR